MAGIERKQTRQIRLGSVRIGGFAPISVQSMTNTYTHEVDKTVAQIHRLQDAGCEIVRVAVPDEASAAAISEIKKRISIPIVADIHFNYRLAVAAAASGADGLRINPGNICSKQKVRAVAESAKSHGIPIRIGVNSGSLPKDLLEKRMMEIKAKTLIIWGDTDNIFPASSAAILDEGIPDSQAVIMKQCGHVPMIERPEETARYYLDFIK